MKPYINNRSVGGNLERNLNYYVIFLIVLHKYTYGFSTYILYIYTVQSKAYRNENYLYDRYPNLPIRKDIEG